MSLQNEQPSRNGGRASPRVLISGASIAGPALAFWLHRYGFEVTVVEKAGAVRPGGREVDFKGPVHLAVLDKMGILGAVLRARVPSDDGVIVDARGRATSRFPGRFAGGDINVPRGDLALILYGLTANRCEYVFRDSISALDQTADGVEVTFERSPPRTFDLVVAADGIHSNVRRLAFGPEAEYVKHLGYHYALVSLDLGDAPHELYNEPGRGAMLGGRAPAFFVFASEPFPGGRDDVEAQKRFLIDAFRGTRWRLPELMDKVPYASGFYMDAISRVTMDRYSNGRVALIGDAAYGNTLGGFGTGLALVAAYVLAGELHRAAGDHGAAFSRYEAKYRGYSSVSQRINAGRLMAPATRLGIRARNLFYAALAASEPLIKLVERPARSLKLEDYGAGIDAAGSRAGHPSALRI